MSNSSYWLSKQSAFLTLGLTIAAVVPLVNLATGAVSAAQASNANFPDIQKHWARPFIVPLAEKDIIAGYPDGTFRPNNPVKRDEFAALVREAFNQESIRKIASGSVYKDVPAKYWAAPAIEEAYETGFMTGFPGGNFRPNQNITRVQALVALRKNLNLTSTQPVAAAAQTATNQRTTNQVTTQQASTGNNKKRIFFPLAMTSLMQPMLVQAAPSQPQPVSNKTVATKQKATSSKSTSAIKANQKKSVTLNNPASITVSKYYTDAKQIPYYAVD
ncbi:MAG: S-layer homology domain-containing protein, partial [Coleofasciculaceae cyanobacterium]